MCGDKEVKLEEISRRVTIALKFIVGEVAEVIVPICVIFAEVMVHFNRQHFIIFDQMTQEDLLQGIYWKLASAAFNFVTVLTACSIIRNIGIHPYYLLQNWVSQSIRILVVMLPTCMVFIYGAYSKALAGFIE